MGGGTMSSTLQISVNREGGETRVACTGEIDASNVAELDEAIGWSMTCDLRTLHVDMTEVSFIDSSAMQALLTAAKECDRRAIGFETDESREVARLLDLVGIRELLRGSLHFDQAAPTASG
jgi:anti-anti-sigma factor